VSLNDIGEIMAYNGATIWLCQNQGVYCYHTGLNTCFSYRALQLGHVSAVIFCISFFCKLSLSCYFNGLKERWICLFNIQTNASNSFHDSLIWEMEQNWITHTRCRLESRSSNTQLDNIWRDRTHPPAQHFAIFFRQWFNYDVIIANTVSFISAT